MYRSARTTGLWGCARDASRSGIPGCLGDYDLMAGAYEMLAADCDWMFDDELANGRAINHPATARLLQRTSSTSAVLDAACGTGVDAAVLARRGFTERCSRPNHDTERAGLHHSGHRRTRWLFRGTWSFRPVTTSGRGYLEYVFDEAARQDSVRYRPGATRRPRGNRPGRRISIRLFPVLAVLR